MFLKADPYFFQTEEFDRESYHSRDIAILSDFLGKYPEEVIDASSAFQGRDRTLLGFIFSVKFLASVFKYELTESAETLAVCSIIFAIEGVMQEFKQSKRLSDFFEKFLTRSDKLKLLAAYAFTEPYDLGSSHGGKWRHLMFSRMLRDGFCDATDVPHCLTNIEEPFCHCTHWLKKQDDKVFNRLIRNLAIKMHDMRCAVVHDGHLVSFIAPSDLMTTDTGKLSASSTLDAYALNNLTQMVSYHSGIKRKELLEITKSGLWECFRQGAKFEPTNTIPYGKQD